jgi:uncharacterized protein
MPEFHPLYIQFFTCYHRKEYWEAHEVLEELWQTCRGNDFYHGLIQIAAMMHQLQRGKVQGARKLAISALRYLEPFSPYQDGVQIDEVLDWLTSCLEVLPANIEKMDLQALDQLHISACKLPHLE